MLMVAPRGKTKELTSLDAPSFCVHFRLIGSVPTLDALEKANSIAGIISLKNVAGLRPPSVRTASEYTIRACAA